MQINLSVIKRSRRNQQHLFFISILLSLAAYGVMWFEFPLVPHYLRVPTPDLRTFTPSLTGGMLYGFLFLALYGFYLLAYYLVSRFRIRPQIWLIVGTAVLYSLPLLYTYPANSTDLFRYLLHGRITSIYGQNTYTTPPAAFPNDPYTPLAGEWLDETSPYGPIWELITAGVTAVTPNNFYAGILALKILGLGVFIGSSLLVWQLLAQNSPAIRTGYTILWAWNPALLLIFVMHAHNDALMIFWMILGVWILRRGYPILAFLALLLAVLTKPVALFSLPLFGLACWRSLPDRRARSRFFRLTAVGGLFLTWLAFLPFGSPLDLAGRLLSEATNFAGFSPFTLILLTMKEQGIRVTAKHLEQLATGGRIILLGVMGWLAWRTWQGRSPIRGTADIFFAYIVQAFNFRIWYAAWPFPWLLLDDTDGRLDGRLSYRLRLGLSFLLTTQLSVVIYGHLHAYQFDFEDFPTHLVGLPFTFGLPLLLAALPGLDQLVRPKINRLITPFTAWLPTLLHGLTAHKPHSNKPQTKK